MKNFAIYLLSTLLLVSCSREELVLGSSLDTQIRNDIDFIELVHYADRVLNDEVTVQQMVLESFESLISSLDEKYITNKPIEDQELFKSIFYEEIGLESNRVLPFDEFGTSHAVYASIEDVWFALEDVLSFPEWNPFTPRVETTFGIGSPIIMYVRLFRELPDIILRQPETVTDFVVQDEMCWETIVGSEFWLKTHRCYVVESVSDQETILQSTMRYDGLLAPMTSAFSKGFVFDGFHDVANAMKDRLE